MNTALPPTTERSTATTSLPRYGHPHGRTAQGKAAGHPLFADALVAASTPDPQNINAALAPTEKATSKTAKKDALTDPPLQEATVPVFTLPAPAAEPATATASNPTSTNPTATAMATTAAVQTPDSLPTGTAAESSELPPSTDGVVLPETPAATTVAAAPHEPAWTRPTRTDTETASATVGKTVSAAAKTTGRALPPPQALVQAMGLDPTAAQAWHMSAPGAPGNRLQNENVPVSSDSTVALDGTATALTSASQSQDNQGSDDTAGDHTGAFSAASGASETPSLTEGTTEQGSDTPFAQSLGEAMGEAFQNLGTQVSYWAGQNVRRASIKLDIGTDQPLQVEVTLDGDKAQLDFRTNDAAARAALQYNAEPVLNDLLARSGLGLAGLSVGAQPHQFNQHNPQPDHANTRSHASGNRSAPHLDTEAPKVQRWIQRSTSTVDIYA